MNLPITAVIVVAVTIMIVVGMTMFFLQAGGSPITTAQAQEVFSSRCLNLCGQDVSLAEGDNEFLNACETLYNMRSGGACLGQCPGSCLPSIDACRIACGKIEIGKGDDTYIKVIRSKYPNCKC